MKVPAAEFKSKCLSLLDRVHERGEPITITNGDKQLYSGRVPRTIAALAKTLAERGDPHEAIDQTRHSLEPLLEMAEQDEAGGLDDLPYPPNYPKMPGEPKRVQPSRARRTD